MKIYILFTINAMEGFGPGKCNESSSTGVSGPGCFATPAGENIFIGTHLGEHI